MRADFSGYATKNNLKCSDGRTIMPGAFKHNDKAKVPLVWQHQHNAPENILGHAILENREDGVYAYGFFNGTEAAEHAKTLVKHGDIEALSIYANNLTQQGQSVLHGDIREVSLVLSGANPGAFIDNVNIQHSDGVVELEDEAVIYTGLKLEHEEAPSTNSEDESKSNELDDKTVKEIVESMTEEQKNVTAFLVAKALEEDAEDGEEDEEKSGNSGDSVAQSSTNTDDDHIQHNQEDSNMTRNVFESGATTTAPRPTLTHDQLTTIVNDAKRLGSFKESFLAHAVEYGIENIDLLFPDAKALTNAPELVGRRTEWVAKVLGGAKKNPFSRIKSLSADITHEEARAKGYVKGNLKKEEWFGLAKRVTTPTTVYKKQKLDRDDIIDITDLDVVAWLKAEMRLMLDEEIARAALIGDGREVDDEDKISEEHIRPIAHDHEFYSHKVTVPANVSGDALIESILRARPQYRGAGNPTMFCTEDVLTDLLLLKDKMGRRLYRSVTELATELRVSEIVTVPVMDGHKTNEGDLLAILVNMSDYTFGADRGGQVSMFDDFDIDYNQYKYLIEGRSSGALTKFKTAIVVSRASGTMVTPTVPTFNASTGVVTIPSVTGVTYKNGDTDETLSAGAQAAIGAGESIEIVATPNTGYYFPHNTDADWVFTRDA